jgi:hypothetical protein
MLVEENNLFSTQPKLDFDTLAMEVLMNFLTPNLLEMAMRHTHGRSLAGL